MYISIGFLFQGLREMDLSLANNYDKKQSSSRPEPDRATYAPVGMSKTPCTIAAQFSLPESSHDGVQLQRQGSHSVHSSGEPTILPVLQRQLTYPPG